MTQSETAENPPEAWLHPDDDEMPPPALQQVYARLPLAVTRQCEHARKAMRDGYESGLRKIHDALAPSGLFKDWCEAADIPYRTAVNAITRAKKQAGDTKSGKRPPASKPSIVLRFTDKEERAEVVSRLREVLDKNEIRHDDFGQAVIILLDHYDSHAHSDQPPDAGPRPAGGHAA